MRLDPIALLCFLLLPLLAASGALRKSSRQYLPPIPGYVPVYIQDGDVPPDVSSLVRQQVSRDAARAQIHADSNTDADAMSFTYAQNDDTDDDADAPLKESGQEIVQQLTQGPAARLFLNAHPVATNKA